MSSKVCYRFGAGASAEVFPVVKNIPEYLQVFRNEFIAFMNGGSESLHGTQFTSAEMEENFLKGLDDLIRYFPQHARIDTYAKMLRITDQGALYNQLKAVFSTFLVYLQVKEKADRRYESFFASILGTHSTDFVSDIKILSWNYDFQSEKSYNAFSRADSLVSNQMILDLNYLGQDKNRKEQMLSIYKLNGTAGFFNRSWRDYDPILDKHSLDKKEEYFKEAIDPNAASLIKGMGVSSSLSFTWDNANEIFMIELLIVLKGRRYC